MNKIKFQSMIWLLIFLINFGFSQSWIRINQLGYFEQSIKIAITKSEENLWRLTYLYWGGFNPEENRSIILRLSKILNLTF
ncbi:MAG: hypothetical protein FJ213_02095 [Ignavibacteria bacterium]|nr:hypothetical protein [Ignavibacteria bacterium]